MPPVLSRILTIPAILISVLLASVLPASAAPTNIATANAIAAELNRFATANPSANSEQVDNYVRSSKSTQLAQPLPVNTGIGSVITIWEVGGSPDQACVLPPSVTKRYTAVKLSCTAWLEKNANRMTASLVLVLADQMVASALRTAQAEVAANAKTGPPSYTQIAKALKYSGTGMFTVSSTKNSITLKSDVASATYRLRGGKLRR